MNPYEKVNPNTALANMEKAYLKKSININAGRCTQSMGLLFTVLCATLLLMLVSSIMSDVMPKSTLHYRVLIYGAMLSLFLQSLRYTKGMASSCFGKHFDWASLLVIMTTSSLVMMIKQPGSDWYVRFSNGTAIDMTLVSIMVGYTIYWALLSRWRGGMGMSSKWLGAITKSNKPTNATV
jgi:hypothetical protein